MLSLIVVSPVTFASKFESGCPSAFAPSRSQEPSVYLYSIEAGELTTISLDQVWSPREVIFTFDGFQLPSCSTPPVMKTAVSAGRSGGESTNVTCTPL